jgi:hypothetical protein
MKPIKAIVVATSFVSVLLLAAIATPLVSQERARPPDQNQPQDTDRGQAASAQVGVEVQARGEIHEAFAQPSISRQRPSPIVHKQPPEPVNELPPDQKPEGDNVQWIPGYWAWDEDRSDFLWVSGTWRDVPPERRWVPGYWTQADDGWRWVSGYWNNHQLTSVDTYSEPPELIAESVPPSPNDNSNWVPGIWVNRTNQWWWRPGFFITYRPGWCWVNAGYWWTPAGYVFIDGYWDYDLDRRGICFAPAVIASDFYLQPNWFYRPSFVIATDFLFGSLFVNVGRCHYFFGDFYDPGYARLGYQPWVAFATTNRFDPLFSYYHWRHRDNPRWQQEIQNTFAERRDGRIARPPRTLAELQRTAPARGQAAGISATPIVALNQFKPTEMKLQRISETQMRDLQTSATRSRTLGQERSRLETRRSSLYQPPAGGGGRETGERREGERLPPERRTETGQPPEKRETLPPEKRENLPPERREPGKIPPERDRTLPPDTGRNQPPPDRRENIPEQRREPTREAMPPREPPQQPSRVDLPKSEHTYRPPQADHTPPPRPQHPEPKQQPPERKPPEKTPGKPG